MLEKEDKVIAGVSGGADSICLFFVLKNICEKKGCGFEVVHVEHGLRGEESLADAEFVKNLCETHNIPFHLYSYDIAASAKEWKTSVEEAGRKVRYEAFADACGKYGGTKIAVAHNANDNAETFLWNLVRGSGLKGLGGIRPMRDKIIRPLLGVTREEIEEYLQEVQSDFRTDRTNLETCYTRNKLRLEVIPYLEREVNAKAGAHIAGACERLRKIEDYMEHQGRIAAESMGIFQEGGVRLRRADFLAEEEVIQEYVIRYVLEALHAGLKDVTSVHIEDIRKLAKKAGKELYLPAGLQARTTEEWLELRCRPDVTEDIRDSKKDNGVILNLSESVNESTLNGGVISYEGYLISVSVAEYHQENIPENQYTKWFNYDIMKDTICLRHRREGDYLVVNDAGGRKKLKDYFINEKIPREQRDRVLLLAEGAHILWVVGHRISEAYKVTEQTKKILKIHVMEE